MAIICALDTSATPVSCAVLQDEKVLASLYAHTGKTHSQTLMPLVETALQMADISVKDVDALAVSVGPGSFTGVRIGVSAVKGLAFADDIPCVPVSTLEAMATPMIGLPFSGTVCAVMDARCRQVYTACFKQKEDGSQQRLSKDEALSLEELARLLDTVPQPIMLVGDGSAMAYRELHESVAGLRLVPPAYRYQTALGVALTARKALEKGETVSSASLLPTYLRLPQAERELRHRQEEQH